jgi:hypothetical protein
MCIDIHIMGLQAYWNSLVDDLHLVPPSYDRVLRIIKKIQHGLDELSILGTVAEAVVANPLDLAYMREQVKCGPLTWSTCTAFVNFTLERVQRMQVSLGSRFLLGHLFSHASQTGVQAR